MKRSSIFALIVIAAALGIMITSLGNSSSYVTFAEAEVMADKGNDNSIHVIGKLNRDAEGHAVGILPSSPMEFAFKLVDNEGREEEVHYAKPMPPDFMESEQVVIIGGFRGEGDDRYFLAEEILLKCPSKYEETEIQST